MRLYILSVCIILAMATAVYSDAKVKWWPGERPTPKAAGSLTGVVVGYTPTTLTVQTEKDGTPIFTVNGDTVVVIMGKRAALKDLQKGDKVLVKYFTLPDDNVLAKTVTVPRPTDPDDNGVVFGRVTAISPTAITVGTEKDGPQTFAITAKIWVRILGQEGTLDQVKIKDPVLVAYQKTNTGTEARSIRVLAEGIQPPLSGGVSGQVTEISPDVISIQSEKDGSQSFGITEKTRVSIYGEDATLDKIGVGANVHVGYIIQDDGVRVASSISIPIPSFGGKIVAVNTGGFTIETKNGPVAFSVTPQTKYTARYYTGSLADLRPGYNANVRGIPDGNTVRAIQVNFSVPMIKGVVESKSNAGITVKTPRGNAYGVSVSNATIILVRPRNAPNYRGTLADVKRGTPINVGGHITGPDTVEALMIELMVP